MSSPCQPPPPALRLIHEDTIDRWPVLTRAADLAGSAARPSGVDGSFSPGLRAPLPRPANASRWRRTAPNRGFHLPARSAAPRTSPHPAGEERVCVGGGDGGDRGRKPIRQGRKAGDGGGEKSGSRGACGEMVTGVRSGEWTPMRDSGSVTIRSADPGQQRTPHNAASPGGHEAATWRQHREKSGSRGACGETVTGVRSGGWTPMRDSGAVTIRSADPGQDGTPRPQRGESRRARGRDMASAQGGGERAIEGWEWSETTPQAAGEMGAGRRGGGRT